MRNRRKTYDGRVKALQIALKLVPLAMTECGVQKFAHEKSTPFLFRVVGFFRGLKHCEINIKFAWIGGLKIRRMWRVTNDQITKPSLPHVREGRRGIRKTGMGLNHTRRQEGQTAKQFLFLAVVTDRWTK